MAVVQRVAVVQRLVQNSRLICSRFSRGGDLDWSLFTGGCCSEVAVSTVLTVFLIIIIIVRRFFLQTINIC